MPFDLQVFPEHALGRDDLRRLVAEAGLGVDEADDAAAALTVVRGVKRRYSFFLEMPVAVEPEDVPEEVTSVLLAPSFLYQLFEEGSSSAETPHAVRFARRLAEASSGVVFDQQTGQTWARGKLRVSPPVQHGRIDVVELNWYSLPDGSAESEANAWLDVARHYLPEALPRRFGPVEPRAMKLDVDGPDAFVRAVAGEKMSLSFNASAPCIEGSLAGGARGQDIRSHHLSVHRAALNDPRWRDALEQLFVEFASRTGAFFASAEVRRGVLWTGRRTWYDASVEDLTSLDWRLSWCGLLPYPAWWTWFGPEYAPLVVDHLPAEQVRSVGDCLFHARGAAPLDRDQLTAALGGPGGSPAPRRWLRSLFSRERTPDLARTWLPDELLATVDASDPDLYTFPVIPAVKMPTSLRPGS